MTAWIAASDVQAWLGADKITADAAGTLAAVATSIVQTEIERDLSLATNTDVLDTNGTNYVLVSQWPIRAVIACSLNGQALDGAGYQQPGWLIDSFNPRKLMFLGYGKLPRGSLNVSVNYTAGYDLEALPGDPLAIPGNVTQALLLTAAAVFNSQAADPNLVAESTAGVFSGSFAQTGVGALPPGARTLLANYKRVSP